MRRSGRLCDLADDVGAGAKAGIQQTSRDQLIQYGSVFRKMLRLHSHFVIPIETEPRQVLPDRGGELGAAACRVDILQAQQKLPAALSRTSPRDQRGECVAEMQIPGRA